MGNVAITKGLVAAFMEKTANDARLSGETVQQAYARLLKSDADMRALYDLYQMVPRDAREAEIKKSAVRDQKVADASMAQLKAMAIEYAKKNGVTYEKAYSQILRTPEGYAFYRDYRAAIGSSIDGR